MCVKESERECIRCTIRYIHPWCDGAPSWMPGRAALLLLGSAVQVASGDAWRLGWGDGLSSTPSTETAEDLPDTRSVVAEHDHPAVVAHWCNLLVAREVSCSTIADICGAVCDQHTAQRERFGQEYPGKAQIDPSAVLATAKSDGAVRRGRCAVTLADRYGINLEILHGEDIFKSFRNGLTGPAQRDVQLDISGWGECPCSESIVRHRRLAHLLGHSFARRLTAERDALVPVQVWMKRHYSTCWSAMSRVSSWRSEPGRVCPLSSLQSGSRHDLQQIQRIAMIAVASSCALTHGLVPLQRGSIRTSKATLCIAILATRASTTSSSTT